MQLSLPDLLRALAVILVGIAAHAVKSMKPVVIGAYIQQLGITADRAGYLLTTEMVASSIGTALVVLLPRYTRGRRLLVAMLAVILVGNLVSIVVRENAFLLAITRLVCGLGEGFGLAWLAIAIASFRQPDRVAGLYSVMTAAFAAIGALAVPGLTPVFGSAGLFVLLALMVLPALLLLRHFPLPQPVRERVAAPGARKATRVVLGLGLTLYYIAIGAYWPFVGVIGTAAGFDYAATSQALAAAGVAMVVASCIAIVTGHGTYSGWLMVVLFVLGVIGVVIPMAMPASLHAFAISACLFAFSWFALFPFLLGLMSRLDPSGQMNGFLYLIAAGAFAVGPGIAGWIVGPAGRIGGIAVLQLATAVVLACGGLVLVSFAWRRAVPDAHPSGEVV